MRIVLLGWPVSHSLSPRMHRAGLTAVGLSDWVYEARAVRTDDFRAAWDQLWADPEVRGANLTVPHKSSALEWVEHVDPAARVVGAINTIVREADGLAAYNTDVEGVVGGLRSVGAELRGGSARILGAGGAARAVLAALYRSGLASVEVAARREERARALIHDLESIRPPATVATSRSLDPRDSADPPREFDLVVNATSIGLEGDDELPCVLESSRPGWAFDCVYGTGPTRWLAHAKSEGWGTIDGRTMLLHQAIRAFTLWTGRSAPVEVMSAALE